ncbi:MAG: penicillin-binding transpeptidase domain-containing protein [Candidatus Omnitrophota bacterium]
MYIPTKSVRKHLINCSFFFLLVLLLIRLSYIHFFRSNFLKDIARRQQSVFVEVEPVRGAILDRNLSALAVNVPADSLYAVPKEIKQKEKTARLLANILQLDYSFLKERLSRDKSFIWLSRKISPEQSKTIRKLNIEGLGFIRESKRSYPKNILCSHVLGVAGLDNIGLEGLELFYNQELSGKKGWSLYLRDARQRKLIGTNFLPAKDGFSLVLNIDEVIQFIAETELDKALKKFHAKGASIVLLDPNSGRILAMANRPTYNPNDFKASSAAARRNRAICDFFEPGSVFKIVTASAALEEKKVAENDKFFCENGEYRVANHILHDHTPHGWLSFTEVIAQSSNIGVTKIAKIVGAEILYRYINLFGFGKTLGVDLYGEVKGVNKPPSVWSKTSIAAVPIGQEVTVTALQLASAISVIANGGLLMQPFIVDSIVDENNNPIRKNYPQILRRVISQSTAERLKKILVEVVESGTGKLAKVDYLKVAGKTGTAQKVEENGTYSHSKFTASFIGFAPADRPQIAMAIIFDEPHPYYGGVVAAPVFKEVATKSLRYLNSRYYISEVSYETKKGTP